jgi:N-acetylglucosamine-6-phosphate deacetylase
MKTIISHGRIITPQRIIPNGSLLMEGGIIRAISDTDISDDEANHIDARGDYVSPGFIDLHVHGGNGFDFMDGGEESFLQIAQLHIRYGTTAMMPTTLTGNKESMMKVLAVYEKANSLNKNGAAFLGVHLEGPYFSMKHRGAQDPKFIRNPDPDEYEEILGKFDCIRRWSVAPELEGAMALGKQLIERGIIASIAHTDALYDDIERAVANGYSLITHLYSAMNGVIRKNAYRFAGTVEAAFLLDALDVEIIADGKHLPVPLLQLVYKIKGANKIALITDAMRATGTNVDESIIGPLGNGLNVIIEDGVAKLPDRTAFAGSVATTNRLVRVMWKQAGIPLPDVIEMMSGTPARIAHVDGKKGSLIVGKDADIVIFDDEVDVKYVFREGEMMVKK